MNGINVLHVVFDASGSFHEFGKKDMLEHIGNSVMNMREFSSWSVDTEFRYYLWNQTLTPVEDVADIKVEGEAKTEALKSLLKNCHSHEAIIVITDGMFDGIKEKWFKEAVSSLGRRFKFIAAGFDANVTALKKVTPNVRLTEDLEAVVRLTIM